jgi:phage terminase small subunit
VEACEEINRNGLFLDRSTKHGLIRTRNPAWDVKKDAVAIIVKCLDRFGMAPRMRTGLRTELPDTDDEELLAQSVFGE